MQRFITIIAIAFVIILSTLISFPVLADSTNDSTSGAKIFEANCAGCHANGSNIIRRGKNLKLKALQKNKVDTQEAIADLVTNGKNNMSAYKDRLTAQEIADVSAYVLQQAEQNWK
ncbi:MAG: cytochrome c6 PetJ [Waterburya sp.]